MNELSRNSDARIRLEKTFASAVGHFRKCEDINGLECFLNVIEDIEILLDINKNCRKLNCEVKEINRLLQSIIHLIENQDIAGLTDVIEFELYPLIKALTKEDFQLYDNCKIK